MNCPSVMNPKDSLSPKPERRTLGDWLTNARTRLNNRPDEPISSLYALSAHILDQPTHFGLSHPEYQLDHSQLERLDDLLSRLLEGVPLPYLTGKQEFYGLEFTITRDVLIPRPETELLVEMAVNWLDNHRLEGYALDIGTGSGCIAISICANVPKARFIGIDRSFTALGVAKGNVNKHHLNNHIHLLQLDLIEGLTGKFGCICANLPYIPSERLPELSVTQYEPLLALDGGERGLESIKRLLSQSTDKIAPDGVIFLEIDLSQVEAVSALSAKHFPDSLVKIENDMAGLPRVAVIQVCK